MSIGNDQNLLALYNIQQSLHPGNPLCASSAYSCDCTGCSNACYEQCGDGNGPVS